MSRTDLEREYNTDDMLAREAKWLEEEQYYAEQERNKRLPAIIKVMIPFTNTKNNKKIKS